jgi:diguanylate cyclase (GGDEF)-like protein
MSLTNLDCEPVLLAEKPPRSADRHDPHRMTPLKHWWRQQTTPLVEDEAIASSSVAGRPTSLVVPIALPVLVVAALVIVREPTNMVAAICLALGNVAIAYGAVAEMIEQRAVHPLGIRLLNTAVFAAIISAELFCFLTIDHPRPSAHWIVFILYFLLIGATVLSDDPRQPVCAGMSSIVGYIVVLGFFVRSVEAGTSQMAIAIAPQLDWATNAAQIALLAGATMASASTARRGRFVHRMSLRDGLTGLLNRHAFDRCLEHLAQRADRRGLPLTIAMIDIDHFKQLNDAHGHSTGDAVLRWLGGWLRDAFRSTDVVSRYGGEEFVVAFVDSGETDALCLRLEALRAGIEHSRLRTQDTDNELNVTVSIGIAHLPQDGTTVNEVLSRADERLYGAKASGRNRIVAQTAG